MPKWSIKQDQNVMYSRIVVTTPSGAVIVGEFEYDHASEALTSEHKAAYEELSEMVALMNSTDVSRVFRNIRSDNKMFRQRLKRAKEMLTEEQWISLNSGDAGKHVPIVRGDGRIVQDDEPIKAGDVILVGPTQPLTAVKVISDNAPIIAGNLCIREWEANRDRPAYGSNWTVKRKGGAR